MVKFLDGIGALFLDVIKLLLPFLGVLMGWALSQKGERSKIIRDDKRKLKRTIFYLLEVRHQLSIYAGINDQISIYLSAVLKNGGSEINAEARAQIETFITTVLQGIVAKRPLMTAEDMVSLGTNFSKCIDSLSEIDPVLAFRLNGRNNVNELFKDFGERVKVVLSEMTNDPKDIESLNAVFDRLRPILIRETVKEIESVLLDLSNRVDKATSKMVRHKIKAKPVEDLERQIQGLIDQLLKESGAFGKK